MKNLQEAKISGAKVGSAMSKIISYLERQMSFKLRKLGVEKFKNSTESGYGIRYVEDGTVNCIRFNWEGTKSSEIVSVDLWNGSSRDPNFHIVFKDVSLAKSLPTLVQVLRKPKVGTVPVKAEPALAEAIYDPMRSTRKHAVFLCHDQGTIVVERIDLPADHPNKVQRIQEAYITEAKKGEYTPETAIADMVAKLQAGRTFNRSEFVMSYHPENAHAFDEFVEQHRDELVIAGKRIGLAKGQKLGQGSSSGDGELVVSRGGRGEEYDEPELERIEQDDRVSFSESLEHLEGLCTGLINGAFNALFVAGRGGTGKTQTIEDTLSEHGLSDGSGYFKITGSASPIGIYTALYKNRDGIVLFDDCDGALDSQDGRNIIKAATDTKKKRKIAWGKKSSNLYDPDSRPDAGDDSEDGDDGFDDDKIPSWFEFTGRVIFISNLPINKLDPDGALRTRAFLISIDPTPEEIFGRMEEILNDIKLEAGSLSAKERQKVLDVVKTSKRAKDASLRTLVRALNLASSGAPNWEKLVQLYC
jgi:hypothetical protein